MNFIFLVVFGVIIILILIFGLPRKNNKRKPSIEGIDDPDVAKAFERMSNILPFKLLRRKIVNKLKKYDLKGLVIDIGCGSGNLIIQIAKNFNGIEPLGIDISDEILELAKKRAALNGVNDKVKFKTGNVESLPLSDNSAEFIVSSFSLHHWISPKKALSEVTRVLKKDGILLIFDFRRDSRRFFYGLLKFATKIVAPKALKKINEPLGSLKASYTKEEVRAILSDINISEVKIESFLAWMFIIIKKA
ncbi:MAG: class I SAM-dependent methyltransferase [Candidatus Thorarchaeota archaeon]